MNHFSFFDETWNEMGEKASSKEKKTNWVNEIKNKIQNNWRSELSHSQIEDLYRNISDRYFINEEKENMNDEYYIINYISKKWTKYEAIYLLFDSRIAIWEIKK